VGERRDRHRQLAVRTIGPVVAEDAARRRARSLLIRSMRPSATGAVKVGAAAVVNRTGLTANFTGLQQVEHVEHRLFSYIRLNWRGQPLVSLAVIVNLMDATRTAAGRQVR
jgi:Rhodopirellula transposase DDE domain